jgi:RNA polymerase sigma-70 factor (ECF subfamily)
MATDPPSGNFGESGTPAVGESLWICADGEKFLWHDLCLSVLMEPVAPNVCDDVDAALRRVIAGEREAFEIIIRKYEQPLRGWLAAQTPPGVDVDELAQRSFVAAFVRLKEFELGTNFSAWLFAIARFQLKTETTRLRRIADYRARLIPDILSRELERRSQDASEGIPDRLEYLRACIRSLGKPMLQFLSWRYDEEISLEEMSRRSGRSVAAVKKQLWILRQKLKECIDARSSAAAEKI